MNTVQLCFTATVTCLAVAISWSATDAMVCCDLSLSVYDDCHALTGTLKHLNNTRFPRNKSIEYHKLETIGNGKCDDEEYYDYRYQMTRVWPVPLCLVWEWGYKTIYFVRLIERLRVGFPAAADAVMVGYYSHQAECNDKQVLLRLDVPDIDVPAFEVRRLFEGELSDVKLPQGYCFHRTYSGGIEAHMCRPRELYCGQDGYTCVNKCCSLKEIFLYSDDGLNCDYNYWGWMPINMPVYETDADGRPVRLSNRTKSSNFIFNPQRPNMEILKRELFNLTTDGSLYRNDKKKLVMDTRYCVEYVRYSWSEYTFHAFIWDDDTESMAENKRGSWMYLISQASNVTSAVCLALTLLVYVKLSYLRNVHGYYVMCYMACELMWFVCEIINKIKIFDNIVLFNRPFGILFNCTYLRNIIFLIMCMSVMQTANLILFMLTAIHCSRIKSELNKFNPTDSKTESFLDYKKKFVMNIKLFLIMGMPRSSQIIPYFFQKETIIWGIFDAAGSLQGVFVFIIFVVKHKIIMDLRKHFKRSMDHCEQTPLNTISGSS